MNIFNKVTLQSMKKSRTRTLVTIIGVALSAAMITAVITFGVSLLSYLTKGAVIKYGDWHAAFLDVDSSFMEERSSDEGVADTSVFENIGYAAIDGSRNPDKPYLFIVGFNEHAFDTLPITLISGRMPENSSEILVSGSVAANGGIKYEIGETLSLAVGNRMNGNEKLCQNNPYIPDGETFVPKEERTYTVVGICQRPSFEEYSAPGYTLITKADSDDKADSFSLFIKLANPRNVHRYAESISGNHAYIFNDNVLRFMGLSDDNLFNGLLYSVGAIVIAIIMTGSIFLIYNSFNISLNERTRQFGILSSVGATARQLQNSVLFEGFCIGAVGIPIGVITGIGFIGIVISVVSKNFGGILYNSVPLTLTLSVPSIISAAAVSLITIMISAYIPARKAAKTTVMECIRQTNEVKVEAETVKTSKLAEQICGLEGTLALKNFKRNKKRYRSIVLSLVLSIVLFISVNSFVIYLKQASEKAVMVTDYDIGIDVQDMDDSEMISLYEKLKTVDGIYESSYQSLMNYSCSVKGGDLSDDYWQRSDLQSSEETVDLPVKIQFIDDNTYFNIIKELGLQADEYSGENAKMIAVAKMEENSSKVQGVEELADMFTNPFINLSINLHTDSAVEIEDSKDVNITFVETVPPDTLPIQENSQQKPFFFRVMAPYSFKEKFEGPDYKGDIKGLTFKSKNCSQSVDEMKAIIESEGITAQYNLYNMNKMMDDSRNYIFIANVFSYTFIMMISLIAAANVFNTISTNIKLRRRELAMLRSIGMSDHHFQKMMNFECAFYGIKALLLGLPIAIISSWLIYKGMFLGGADNIDFVLPWGSIGISILSVFIVVFVTMLYAISRIKRENIIDALRDDME